MVIFFREGFFDRRSNTESRRVERFRAFVISRAVTRTGAKARAKTRPKTRAITRAGAKAGAESGTKPGTITRAGTKTRTKSGTITGAKSRAVPGRIPGAARCIGRPFKTRTGSRFPLGRPGTRGWAKSKSHYLHSLSTDFQLCYILLRICQ
ncbi:hypothetical protein DCCM_4164 [Desulfocucumis palustris]|uniref:Uncharacterized protein n=1 Tax=Desulfocucumis palustris TaxID=1898651 RepID=A0A2L2XH53_9FIRM|nr:hypothetical protein [Desulfocucumis palustris]GBF35043.1 hypothetical protein DCCM_4164 [Desulfocucumis palustris]